MLKTRNQNIVKIHLAKLGKEIKSMEESLQFIGFKNHKTVKIDLDDSPEAISNEKTEELSEEVRKKYHQLFQKKHRYAELQALYQKLD